MSLLLQLERLVSQKGSDGDFAMNFDLNGRILKQINGPDTLHYAYNPQSYPLNHVSGSTSRAPDRDMFQLPWSVILMMMVFFCGCSASDEGKKLKKPQSITVESIHWQDDYFIADSMSRDFGSFNMFRGASLLPTHGIYIFAPTERMAHRLIYVADNLDSAFLWL